MGTAHESNRQPTPRPGVATPALVAVALLAAAIAIVVWSMSSAPTLGRLEHEEVSAFSKIRVRRDGDVRALTFVRDNGRRVLSVGAAATPSRSIPSSFRSRTSTSDILQPSRSTRVVANALQPSYA